MFRYVQWAAFILTMLACNTGSNFPPKDGYAVFISFVLATFVTGAVTIFVRPIWNMFAGMFGRDD